MSSKKDELRPEYSANLIKSLAKGENTPNGTARKARISSSLILIFTSCSQILNPSTERSETM